MKQLDQNKAILPTNTCFDDCLDFIEGLLQEPGCDQQAIIRRYQVVHGIYQVTDLDNDFNTNGEPFAHGWVLDKLNKVAWQDGFLYGNRITYSIDIKDFYMLFKPIDETRYSIEKVYRLNILHNNYGPWKPKYIRMCADKKRSLDHAKLEGDNDQARQKR